VFAGQKHRGPIFGPLRDHLKTAGAYFAIRRGGWSSSIITARQIAWSVSSAIQASMAAINARTDAEASECSELTGGPETHSKQTPAQIPNFNIWIPISKLEETVLAIAGSAIGQET
jgi:hypothetical protein